MAEATRSRLVIRSTSAVSFHSVPRDMVLAVRDVHDLWPGHVQRDTTSDGMLASGHSRSGGCWPPSRFAATLQAALGQRPNSSPDTNSPPDCLCPGSAPEGRHPKDRRSRILGRGLMGGAGLVTTEIRRVRLVARTPEFHPGYAGSTPHAIPEQEPSSSQRFEGGNRPQ